MHVIFARAEVCVHQHTRGNTLGEKLKGAKAVVNVTQRQQELHELPEFTKSPGFVWRGALISTTITKKCVGCPDSCTEKYFHYHRHFGPTIPSMAFSIDLKSEGAASVKLHLQSTGYDKERTSYPGPCKITVEAEVSHQHTSTHTHHHIPTLTHSPTLRTP